MSFKKHSDFFGVLFTIWDFKKQILKENKEKLKKDFFF